MRKYSAFLSFWIGAHAQRATKAISALDHDADISKVQEWLDHNDIATAPAFRSSPHAAGGRPHIQY
jgi:site-specific recombinase XerD